MRRTSWKRKKNKNIGRYRGLSSVLDQRTCSRVVGPKSWCSFLCGCFFFLPQVIFISNIPEKKLFFCRGQEYASIKNCRWSNLGKKARHQLFHLFILFPFEQCEKRFEFERDQFVSRMMIVSFALLHIVSCAIINTTHNRGPHQNKIGSTCSVQEVDDELIELPTVSKRNKFVEELIAKISPLTTLE